MNSHREFFTGLAEGWDSMCTYDREKMSLFIKTLDLAPGSWILDVGCGTGVFTVELCARFGSTLQIIGLDISEGMLRKARCKLGSAGNVLLVQGDGATRFLKEGSLDRILCYSCFPHIQDKVGALKAFKSMLREDGLLLIAHSSSCAAVNDFHSRCNGIVKHDHLPGPGEMRDCLEQAGLTPRLIDDSPGHYMVLAA